MKNSLISLSGTADLFDFNWLTDFKISPCVNASFKSSNLNLYIKFIVLVTLIKIKYLHLGYKKDHAGYLVTFQHFEKVKLFFTAFFGIPGLIIFYT